MEKENKNDDEITITKKDMELYEACRKSGKANMLDIKRVEELTGLSREKIIYIMKHYSELIRFFKNNIWGLVKWI